MLIARCAPSTGSGCRVRICTTLVEISRSISVLRKLHSVLTQLDRNWYGGLGRWKRWHHEGKLPKLPPEWVFTGQVKTLRNPAQVLLGAFLTFAGITHLTTNRAEFQAQVPTLLQPQADLVVLVSGVVEIALGVSLLILWRYRTGIGWIVAAFFVAVFWGNISQYLNGVDAFGLDSDAARAVRLVFQPVLVAWALWCAGAWGSFRQVDEDGAEDLTPNN